MLMRILDCVKLFRTQLLKKDYQGTLMYFVSAGLTPILDWPLCIQ